MNENQKNFVQVAQISAIEQGTNKAFDVAGKSILICHTKDGEFYAVENLCSHAIAALEGGKMRKHRLICPLHGASFDMRDGSVLGKPAFTPICAYEIRITNNMIEVLLDTPVG
ncbi:Rieske (2Fe-2S) protein [Emcibacter sp.]|uniref:Rieske (2Fe-2S) protein n=1 Tax=Emcibacter sp. TaxID=1979954 RepID=UPI002AA83460|nr:Rieske 2Fe-2S domain-containing protein [Emcibacter sp.]